MDRYSTTISERKNRNKNNYSESSAKKKEAQANYRLDCISENEIDNFVGIGYVNRSRCIFLCIYCYS